MKSGIVLTMIIIPAFNIFCVGLAGVAGWNPIIAIIPCAIGSFLFAYVGVKSSVEPFMDEYEHMKKELEQARKNDAARSEFVYSISEAYKMPVDSIKTSVKDLKNLGIDKMASNMKPIEPEKPKRRIEYDDDPFELRPKKVDEGDKSLRIDPSKYSGEIIKRRLEELNNAAEKVSKLTEDIIVFSDVQTKKHVAQGGNVNVEHAMDQVVQSLQMLASQRDVTMEIEIEDGVTIEGVEERFVSMMRKLVENAIIYSKSGGTVHISADNVNGYVFVNVRDEGIGIPADQQSKIFERFYRVERVNDPNPYGAGLGLAIVKHLAEIMDAEIKVKSSPNQGSTFSVIFKRGLA